MNIQSSKTSEQQSSGMRKVDFVVLTWNSEAHVRACLESVLSLRGFDVVVHVVDNGSTDGTIAAINVLIAESGERMDVVKAGVNLGTTVSRNIALRSLRSDADYVCVLDSDTIVNTEAFEVMTAALDADPGIGVIGPSMQDGAGVRQLSGRNLPTLGIKLRKAMPVDAISSIGAIMEVPTSPFVDGLQDVPYLLSACWLMPCATLSAVGLLDEAIFYAPEDVDYCVRVWNAGLRVVFCERAEIVHKYQRLSHKKLFSKTNIEHVKGLAHYFRKYGYLFDSSKIAAGKIHAVSKEFCGAAREARL